MSTKVDTRGYISLESALIDKLREAWRPHAVKLYGKIQDATDSGDFAEAYRLAHSIDLTDVGLECKQTIKYLLLAGIHFGASMAAGSKDTLTSVGGYETLLNKVTDNFLVALEWNVTVQAVKSAVQSIAKVEEAQKATVAIKAEILPLETKVVDKRYLEDFVSFAKPTDDMLQLISSQHSSRVATWGFAAEAEVLGYTEYKLSAVLDGRTSRFCRFITGKKFKVEDARKSINEILSVQNPDDVKALQPWADQSKDALAEYAKLSNEELTARNLHIPPFHPRCRTILVKLGSVKSKPPIKLPFPPLNKETSVEQTFKDLGVGITNDQLAYWNTYMGVSPIDVLSQLSGDSAVDILGGSLSSSRHLIKIGTDGLISFGIKKMLKGVGYTATSVIDPLTGTSFLSDSAFYNLSEAVAATKYKKLYSGLINVASSVGVTEIDATTSGTLGSYLHVQAGFELSASGWNSLKTSLTTKLPSVVGLTEQQLGLVKTLLETTDPQALYVLANLPFEVEGVTIGRYLLSKQKLSLSLDLTDQTAIDKALGLFS